MTAARIKGPAKQQPVKRVEPLYATIVRTLRGEIVAGALRIGSNLPPELSLMKRFGVSRHTVRQALRVLRDDGLVSARQGSGTTVIAQGQTPSYVHEAASISDLSQLATDVPYFIEATEMIVTDAKLARRLGCSPRRRWLHITGRRFQKGESRPVSFTEVFVHEHFADLGEFSVPQIVPLHRRIEERFGERLTEVVLTIRALPLTEDLGAWLQAEVGSPALQIQSNYKSANGKVVEISFNTSPADRFSYSTRLRR